MSKFPQEGNPPGIRSQGDRLTLELPAIQEKLMQAVHDTGTPVILVLMNGSAVAVNWADEHVPAILEAWYPGPAGGTAVAEALFGLTKPGGRLPVTFYKSERDLPASAEQMSFVDDEGNWVLAPGTFGVWIGGEQPNFRAGVQPGNVLEDQFIVEA